MNTTELKHTPGPWVAETGLPYNVIQLGEGDSSYCWCPSVEQGESIDYDQERQDADARLMSAAPELLESTEILSGFVAALCEHFDLDDDIVLSVAPKNGGAPYKVSLCDAIRSATTSIGKATGQP